MAKVVYEGVWKRFKDTVAVKEFDLEIPDMEFLVLVGPSGSGKSTALRLLAGLDSISDGKIYIGERVVNDVPPKDRDIAMVFQTYALYPHMSVYDNVAFGLKLRKTDKGTIEERVKRAVTILGIETLLKRKPGQLSGGQRQRVAVARAIVREPKVFLLDEPLSNLDAKLRVQTRAEISKLHQQLGTTFVYVTHDQVEAMTMATRIAVMNFGELQQVGSPQFLYDHPVNVFVAGFIGSPSMNFFEARVEGDGDGLRLLDDKGLSLPIPPKKANALRKKRGQKILLGIRPEDIHDPNFVPPGTQTAPVKARVEVTELMGNEVFLHLTHAGKTFLGRVDPRTQARPNTDFDLMFSLDNMHAFDPETEQTLMTPEEEAPEGDPKVMAPAVGLAEEHRAGTDATRALPSENEAETPESAGKTGAGEGRKASG
jgi:multiple sugar transport system ATP-binding protein